MKKNAMLKIAAILMVAVLLTTCAVSSTFAKYVTEGNTVSDTARIAEWGVDITSTFSGIFAEQYEGGTPVTTSNASDGADVVALSSASAKKLVAPGTQSSGTITTEISGTPEVAFAITTEANVTLTGWEIDADDDSETAAIFYCPLVFDIGGATVTGTDYTSAADMKAAIENAVSLKGTKEYPAGASTVDDFEFVISWTWAFEGNNAYDTKLGDAATANISIELTQTAAQIQDYITPSNT